MAGIPEQIRALQPLGLSAELQPPLPSLPGDTAPDCPSHLTANGVNWVVVTKSLSQFHFYLLIDGFLQLRQLSEPIEFYLQLSPLQGAHV